MVRNSGPRLEIYTGPKTSWKHPISLCKVPKFGEFSVPKPKKLAKIQFRRPHLGPKKKKKKVLKVAFLSEEKKIKFSKVPNLPLIHSKSLFFFTPFLEQLKTFVAPTKFPIPPTNVFIKFMNASLSASQTPGWVQPHYFKLCWAPKHTASKRELLAQNRLG